MNNCSINRAEYLGIDIGVPCMIKEVFQIGRRIMDLSISDRRALDTTSRDGGGRGWDPT